jgi:hypothetical protein
MKIAILDDYQNVALTMADWSRVESGAEITVFTDHVGEPDAVVARPQPFDVVCVMRERTPLPRQVLERLPQLKMIASTGSGNASIDMQGAQERHIHVTATVANVGDVRFGYGQQHCNDVVGSRIGVTDGLDGPHVRDTDRLGLERAPILDAEQILQQSRWRQV